MRSIRQRLVAVALLAALACMGALSAVFELLRTGREQRVERAREAVTRRLEAIEDEPASAPPPRMRPHPERAMHRVPSGRLDANLRPVAGDAPPGPRLYHALGDLAPRARGSTDPVVEVLSEPEGVAVVGLAALDEGGFGWAATRVTTPAALQAWRIGVAILAAASLALVIASLHTLMAFQRGARALQSSVAALSRDLSAKVDRPGLSELDEVANGIASMASELSAADAERDRLRGELAERERLASLGRVAAGVAHEVRNPLASIKLRADLARRAPETPATLAGDLEEISSEVARLDRLVADLLVVAGRRKGPRADTDVGELCRKRVALMEPWATEHGVTVRSTGEARAMLDADGMARAVDNLVRNAIEASPRGAEVRVEVTDEKDAATVRVWDRGVGVPPERARELFEPFFTTKADGTGLGLALSRTVAVAHGGTLTYRRDGEQTCFALRLPHGQSPAAES